MSAFPEEIHIDLITPPPSPSLCETRILDERDDALLIASMEEYEMNEFLDEFLREIEEPDPSQIQHKRRAEIFGNSQDVPPPSQSSPLPTQDSDWIPFQVARELSPIHLYAPVTDRAPRSPPRSPAPPPEADDFVRPPYTEEEKKRMLAEVGRERIPYTMLNNQESAAALGFLDFPPFYRQWRDIDDADFY